MKVFFLVGHANFGKTETINLTKPPKNHYYQTSVIHMGNPIRLRVLGQSNDDLSQRALLWAQDKIANHVPYILFALCPNFTEPLRRTDAIINSFVSAGYTPYFFVLENQPIPPNGVVTLAEISRLTSFGTVQVCSNLDAAVRATDFQLFIQTNLP